MIIDNPDVTGEPVQILTPPDNEQLNNKETNGVFVQPKLKPTPKPPEPETPKLKTLSEIEASVRGLYALGELEMAQMFAYGVFQEWVYYHDEKSWYKWDVTKKLWTEDTTGKVRTAFSDVVKPRITEMCDDLRKFIIENGTSDHKHIDRLWKNLNEKLRYTSRKSTITNCLSLAEHKFPVSVEDEPRKKVWDKDPWVINFENVSVCLRTGKEIERTPADYNRAYAPTEWKGLDEPCPIFEKFLSDIFNNDTEVISFVQRLLGYMLVGEVVEEKFPILQGVGRNGKSTLVATIQSVLGDMYMVPRHKDTLLSIGKDKSGPQPGIVSLDGVRIVYFSEISEGDTLDTGTVKTLTSKDKINARGLYQEGKDFKPTHSPLMMTNPKPHVPPADYAIWERIMLVPFLNKYIDNPTKPGELKSDKNLPTMIETERSGIAAWLVNGCLEWHKNGNTLQPPQVITDAGDAYKTGEDTLGMFIDETCEVEPGNKIRTKELYKAYNIWCVENNIKPMQGPKFRERILDKFNTGKSHGTMHYLGLELNEEATPTSPMSEKAKKFASKRK